MDVPAGEPRPPAKTTAMPHGVVDEYNNAMPIPPTIHGQKYVCLISFRENGVAVPTPVWFSEKDEKLYMMTRSDSGKYKRIRNNPKVQIAPCTMRGRITGPEFAAVARILPPEDWPAARKTILLDHLYYQIVERKEARPLSANDMLLFAALPQPALMIGWLYQPESPSY